MASQNGYSQKSQECSSVTGHVERPSESTETRRRDGLVSRSTFEIDLKGFKTEPMPTRNTGGAL
jgi:hypothetical protein